ncbi:hypothetical protein HNP84_007936 [Thermocatellispora tengchongensis]|uniref:Outer membrane channel protein CpnT-like N-terminal domain-containing protein n=1 Tax=Thermocatellispora tengchongensis TaxID=1073253 RepID=A0A840PJT9_9ACTN|nr:hypothetical protein [Thermocatellispora tengchongensis]MBB5138183.1 hypothetical protein [Thermocatellispora tengchongensis]
MSALGSVLGFAGRHPAWTAGVAGGVTGGAFVTAMLGVEWPEGDPDKLRQAADIWDELAGKLETSTTAANTAASLVWRDNAGAGIDAFREMWTGTFAPYPAAIAATCRRIAAACRQYADVLETVQKTLLVLAIQLYINMLYTIAWGWATAGISTLATRLVERAFKSRAWFAKKFLRTTVGRIVDRLLYYTLDSIAYAGGQQAIQWGVFAASGVRRDQSGAEVTSLGENAEQFYRNFVANMAFNGVADASLLIPGLNRIADTRTGGFVARMLGSTTYTSVDNILQGRWDDPLPDWDQMIAKLIVHGSRAARPPGGTATSGTAASAP